MTEPSLANSSKPLAGGVRLRAARREDVDAIELIEKESFDSPAEVFQRRQIRALIANLHVITQVAEDPSGRVVGWLAALVRRAPLKLARGKGPRGKTGRIYAVAVHPGARGLGVGKALMAGAIDTLAGLGVGRITLEVRWDNQAAIGLYRKLGFVQTDFLGHYYTTDLHGVRMALDLPGDRLGQKPGL